MMSEKNKKLELGRELAEQRENKDLSIQQMSDRTKIAVKNIENIEKGIFDFLPSAYVKAYLSAIATELGLDSEVILRKYRSSFVRDVDTSSFEKAKPDKKAKKHVEKKISPVKVKKPPKAKEPKKEKNGSSKKWIEEFMLIIRFYSVFIFGALFILVVLVIVFFVLPEVKHNKKLKEQQTTVQPESLLVQIREQSADSTRAEPESKEMQLKLIVTDSTWLRIVYNDSISEDAIYAPGDEKSWQSKEPFYLRIGNASGVRLSLDGKDLGKPGREGRITNILVDQEGIKNIKKTEFPPAMGVGGTTQ